MSLKNSLSFIALLFCTTFFAQTALKKVNVTGKVIDKITSQPMEYVTVTVIKTDNNKIIVLYPIDGVSYFQERQMHFYTNQKAVFFTEKLNELTH
jgi:hypothetical protein